MKQPQTRHRRPVWCSHVPHAQSRRRRASPSTVWNPEPTNLAAACAADPELRLRDHAPWALRKAVVELLVRLRVYRPYTTGEQPPRPADVALLTAAAEEARTAFVVPEEAAAVTTVRDLVLGRLDGSREAATFRVRFAQLASALRAKAGARRLDEQPEVVAALDAAQELLWTAPCDLEASEAALARLSAVLNTRPKEDR